MDFDEFMHLLSQNLSLPETAFSVPVRNLLQSVSERDRKTFLEMSTHRSAFHEKSPQYVHSVLYTLREQLYPETIQILDPFLLQVQNDLALPTRVLGRTNQNLLLRIPVDLRNSFLSVAIQRLLNRQQIRESGPYLYECLRSIRNELEQPRGDGTGVDMCSANDEFLSQVQQELGISDQGLDDWNKPCLLELSPTRERPAFQAQAREQLLNSDHFKRKRNNPRYVRACLRDVKDKVRRRLSYDDRSSQPEPVRSQGPLLREPLGCPRAKDQNSQPNDPARPFSSSAYACRAETATSPHPVGQGQCSAEVGGSSLRAQLLPRCRRPPGPGTDDGGDGIRIDAEFDAELVDASPDQRMASDLQAGDASTRFVLEYALELLGVAGRLTDAAVQCVRSLPRMHPFKLDRMRAWLLREGFSDGASESLSAERIRAEFHRLQGDAVPEHEDRNDVDPPDEILLQRKEWAQYSAVLELKDGDIRLCAAGVSLEKFSNCVVRHFWRYRHRFLFVHADEKQKEGLSERLAQGVEFCGLRFEFHLDHDQRAILFAPVTVAEDPHAPEPMRSAVGLMNWLGYLREVQHLSKWSDRLAMAWTPTVFICTLRPDQVRVCDDVMSPSGRYCFTDGVGTYGDDIQELVKRRHPKGSGGGVCALQVRVGTSVKGMLAHDPGTQGIMVRPSMIKFASARLELAVVDVNSSAVQRHHGESCAAPMRINVDILQQLEHLRVPPATLLLVLEEELEKVRGAFASAEHVREVLRSNVIADERVPFDAIQYGMAGGLDINLYPLRSWIEERLNRECVAKLKQLKIPVEKGAPNLKGLTLPGIQLGPREVFIRLTPHQPPLRGRVVVGRHPCNHPGDMQVVEAVSSAQLEQSVGHLHGVVVFPIAGERPLQDMMSGGDLDGDAYWVLWDPRLVPEASAEPLDYGAYKPKPFGAAALGLDGPVPRGSAGEEERRQLVRHFVAHRSRVGILTNLRKLAADKFGPGHPVTVELCLKVAAAHDARSTGMAVEVPVGLQRQVEDSGYPGWWSSAGDGEPRRTRYPPEAARQQAASALYQRVAAFSFGLPPLATDPHLAAPLVGGLASAEVAEARAMVAEYYRRKQRLVQQKQELSQRAPRSASDRQRRGSAEWVWAKAFESLDEEHARVFVQMGQPERATAAFFSAERLKRKAAAWYVASWDRGSSLSCSVLQVPTVLQSLVELKREAVTAATLAQGHVPRAPLVLQDPGHFRVVRHRTLTGSNAD